MKRAGARRLRVISGASDGCAQQAAALGDTLDGDWLWVGEQSECVNSSRPVALLRQDRAPQITPLASRPPWHFSVPGRPTADQGRLLRRLAQAKLGIYSQET